MSRMSTSPTSTWCCPTTPPVSTTARTTSPRKRRPHGKPPSVGTTSTQSSGSPKFERSKHYLQPVLPGLDAEAAGTVARLILGDGDQEPARPVAKALTTDRPTPSKGGEARSSWSGGGASGGSRTPTG